MKKFIGILCLSSLGFVLSDYAFSMKRNKSDADRAPAAESAEETSSKAHKKKKRRQYRNCVCDAEEDSFSDADSADKPVKKKKTKRSSKNKKAKKKKKLENKDDSWKHEQASLDGRGCDLVAINDTIADSSRFNRSSVKIEGKPITELSDSVKRMEFAESGQMLANKDADNGSRADKISAPGEAQPDFQPTEHETNQSEALKHNYRRNLKDHVRFRQELEKYRQMYADGVGKA